MERSGHLRPELLAFITMTDPETAADDFACKVCGARPNSEGERTHGDGCYVVSPDGGGEDYVISKLLEWGQDVTVAELQRWIAAQCVKESRANNADKATEYANMANSVDDVLRAYIAYKKASVGPVTGRKGAPLRTTPIEISENDRRTWDRLDVKANVDFCPSSFSVRCCYCGEWTRYEGDAVNALKSHFDHVATAHPTLENPGLGTTPMTPMTL